MGFTCGLVGLPNAGKSTLFNALTSAGAKVASFPFSTMEPQVGIVPVPDEQLERLAKLFPEKRKVPTTLEFIDIAGLVKGAHRGEGLGNQFLAEIRNVDVMVHVVRCFEDPNVVHPEGTLDPRRDIELVETELLLKDLETLEKKLKTVESQARVGDKTARAEIPFYQRLIDAVGRGQALRQLELHPEEKVKLKEISPLTLKPVLYAANVGEERKYIEVVEKVAAERGGAAVVIFGKLEMEVGETTEVPTEREAYLKEWGIGESGLKKLVRAGYKLLHLVTFYTVDGPEVRAWTVPQGMGARQAAGKIHSDFEKHFIHADVVRVDDLVQHGSLAKLRELGKFHRQGEKYPVQDGDVIHFVVAG